MNRRARSHVEHWKTIDLLCLIIYQILQTHVHFNRSMYPKMLLIGFICILGLTLSHSAAIDPSLQLINETSFLTADPRNRSLHAIDVADSLGGELFTNIDPRLTYEVHISNQILDEKSAYMNTLLALSDLSTKGWTRTLSFDSRYSFSSYGDITIRVHARRNPSDLQYRHAIWGLYRAIRETAAHGFRACVLSLYWSPILGMARHIIGYVTIVGNSPHSIDIGNSTEDAFELALPMQSTSLPPVLTNITTTGISSTTITNTTTGIKEDLKLGINLSGKPLDISLVFNAVYSGIVSLASKPQYQGVTEPGFVEDPETRTFLRWDSTHLTARPYFEYRYAISAFQALAAYMYQQNQYFEARVTIFVDQVEVGRGWLYRNSIGEASGEE